MKRRGSTTETGAIGASGSSPATTLILEGSMRKQEEFSQSPDSFTTGEMLERQYTRNENRESKELASDQQRRGGPVEYVAWREELEIVPDPQEKVFGTVKVHTYVTEEQVTKSFPIERECVRITRESVSRQEAQSLSPHEIAEAHTEIELHSLGAVVKKKKVPTERLRVAVDRVQGAITVNETCKSEHIEVEEPPYQDDSEIASRQNEAKKVGATKRTDGPTPSLKSRFLRVVSSSVPRRSSIPSAITPPPPE